jgi:hypothetical protein
MYCNDASLRIVIKSLYRTAPPFSLLYVHSLLALLYFVPPALVQGPPGTGKSATIVGMVLQMWGARCNMPRILLVAPSNAAVDELARKLLAVKSQLPEDKRFKIIRIGEIL